MITAGHKEFLRFCCVGGLNTLIDTAIFAILYYSFSVPLLLANTAGFCGGTLNSYLLNKAWTFRDTTPHSSAKIATFFLIAAGSLVLSNLTIWVLAPLMPVLLAKLAACGVSVLWNYLLSRRTVFKP